MKSTLAIAALLLAAAPAYAQAPRQTIAEQGLAASITSLQVSLYQFSQEKAAEVAALQKQIADLTAKCGSACVPPKPAAPPAKTK